MKLRRKFIILLQFYITFIFVSGKLEVDLEMLELVKIKSCAINFE